MQSLPINCACHSYQLWILKAADASCHVSSKVATVSKLRLLVVIPELSLGGAARIVRDQAAAFATRYDVTEVVFNLDDGVDYPGVGRLESLDIAGGGSIVDKVRHFAGRVRALARLKRRLGVDLS